MLAIFVHTVTKQWKAREYAEKIWFSFIFRPKSTLKTKLKPGNLSMAVDKKRSMINPAIPDKAETHVILTQRITHKRLISMEEEERQQGFFSVSSC